MKLQRLLLSSLLLTSLVGCGEKIITVTEYRPMPGHYLVDCESTPPPIVSLYKEASEKERIAMWMETYTTQLTRNSLCNLRMKHARDYNDKFSPKKEVTK